MAELVEAYHYSKEEASGTAAQARVSTLERLRAGPQLYTESKAEGVAALSGSNNMRGSSGLSSTFRKQGGRGVKSQSIAALTVASCNEAAFHQDWALQRHMSPLTCRIAVLPAPDPGAPAEPRSLLGVDAACKSLSFAPRLSRVLSPLSSEI
jgi:hypothetical protein